ncbi:hypothetical protein ALP36_102471 [Pseudomonas syringae pv. coriandricola]|uniref:Uncharacterized protein n=1 Tax=Pseudomonas syringae pv. coriandricola TaxID=264453 RepID=A0A3M5RTJ2_9PSED|nr:hypothetical protein ALP36_102471 [Pseudomonas syringae pv. coriandricola]
MFGKGLAVIGGWSAAGRPVIASGDGDPVTAERSLFSQDLRGHIQVLVGVERVARITGMETVAVPAHIHLSQAHVDTLWACLDQGYE